MPSYRYRAVDASGRISTGLRDAPSIDQVAAYLQSQGLTVLDVIEGQASIGSSLFSLRSRALSPVRLAQFTHQLAVLMHAGQPLDRALGTLLSLTETKKSAKNPAALLIERIRTSVKGGRALSSALADETGQFSPLYLAMVRAGEAGGQLADTLSALALYLERVTNLRATVGNAMIYPAFLLLGVVGSIAMLLTYVVPEFVPIFNEMNVPLPWVTRAVLDIGMVFQNAWWALLIGMGAIAATCRQVLARPASRLALDRRILTWRVIGKLTQELESARLTRTLGTLLKHGVPLLQALAIARQTLSNRAIAHAVASAGERVKSGQGLARTLGEQDVLPLLAIQMIQVGEETASLDTMLLKAADFFDTESKRSIERLLAALTPTLTVVMSVLVGGIMMAIMLPLMDMTNNI